MIHKQSITKLDNNKIIIHILEYVLLNLNLTVHWTEN